MRRPMSLPTGMRLSTGLEALALALVCLALITGPVQAAEHAAESKIPARPEQLTFPELSFDTPDAASMRFELSDGTPVYALADRQLPLVRVSVEVRGGLYLVPKGQEGLASVTAEAWRTGGAGQRSAKELDEALDFLAANLTTEINEVTTVVELDVMSKDLDEAMAIMMDVLTSPRFQEDRVAKAKDDLIQDMKTRNDSSATIENQAWQRLIYGDDYWLSRQPTKATVDAITVEDCRSFVTSMARSGNIVVAVSGDFDQKQMLDLLDRTIGTLPKLEQPLSPIPQPDHEVTPGVYVINKPDVNQGRVRFGHIGLRLGHPDEMALKVGTDILGGGGFTARAMKRVRSDEGLAYGAYTDMSFPTTFPGSLASYFQSKSSTCAFATEIYLGLINDMRSEPVTDEELATSKTSFIETFPRNFQSASDTVTLFATDELLGRPHDYWTTFRERIQAVDAAAIKAAFVKHIVPDEMVFLVVGNIAEITKGHPDHEVRLSDLGPITALPLLDPMTQEPMTE